MIISSVNNIVKVLEFIVNVLIDPQFEPSHRECSHLFLSISISLTLCLINTHIFLVTHPLPAACPLVTFFKVKSLFRFLFFCFPFITKVPSGSRSAVWDAVSPSFFDLAMTVLYVRIEAETTDAILSEWRFSFRVVPAWSCPYFFSTLIRILPKTCWLLFFEHHRVPSRFLHFRLPKDANVNSQRRIHFQKSIHRWMRID